MTPDCPFVGCLLLRGGDLNPRPLGYEPNELPLLHPAVWIPYYTGYGREVAIDRQGSGVTKAFALTASVVTLIAELDTLTPSVVALTAKSDVLTGMLEE